MRQPAILAVVWICALLVLTGTLTKMRGQWHRRDFSNYYESAWALRHGIDPYSTNLTPIGAQLGLETNWLVHASETPPFLLCFEPLTRLRPRVAFWIWSAINFSALAIAMYLLLGVSTRPLRPHRIAAGGTDADVGAGESESLLGTIAVDSTGPDGSRDARDGSRARRHCRIADRSGRAVARLSAAARRLFCASSKMARGIVRDQRESPQADLQRSRFWAVAQTLSFVHGALWLTDYR